MNFYESISDHYNHIFPLNMAHVTFVRQSFSETQHLELLDIGCGIGELSFELSKYFKSVRAIDLDKRMVNRAKRDFEQMASNLQFNELNMLEIEKEFGLNSFDAIICFGNTLVHLEGPLQILDFFKRAKNALKNGGKFLFQIINYDRIIDQKINILPTIENKDVRFERNYHLHPNQKLLDFETILTIKKTGQKITNTIQLYLIRIKEISGLLNKAGFNDITYYANFKREDYRPDSIPLIIEAK